MNGKTVLITGGTGGIGRATAHGLAALGAHVVLVARDPAKGDRTVAEIRRQAGNDDVEMLVADLSSQASVRALAGQVEARLQRLDVLVNNAGGFWATRRTTVDGLEHTFAVNHLAPFLLTNLLLDKLKASAPARVVTVSSGAQAMGRLNFDDLQGETGYSGQTAYNQSKLANVMFCYALARRLAGTGVTSTVLHPGVVRSNFGKDDPTPAIRFVITWFKPFLKSPERGARTSIHLASSPEVAGVTGEYFSGKRVRRSAKLSHDLAAGERLWHESERLVGLPVTP
jgi:NAD(P)-dependent dehydrogenase (short-subunit alcohol dehydrogenase family)